MIIYMYSASNIDLKTFLTQWTIKENISQSSLRSLLQGIKQYTCTDCSFNIPLDPRTLVHTPRSTNIEICAGGQYYHFGLKEGILSIISSVSQHIKDIKISVNIDGLPLFKSSQRQFWPILGSISESKKIFIIGLYYGTQKPTNSNEFLAKFVDEAKILHEEGIIINNTNGPCKLHSIICDAPAKAFVLQIEGHNGYSSCTKCIIEGSYINNKMCFPETNAQLRTDEDFRLRKDENYHVGHSAILKLSDFDLVNNVPLDYMHLVCLGIMRKLLYMWLFGKVEVRLQYRKVETISLQLENVLKLYIPCEFVRKPRSLAFVKLWKATEFRTIILYTGCVVFKLLRKNLYNHFLVLHVAIRILCCSQFEEYIDYAQKLLQFFVSSFKLLYGIYNISHNVHGLIHLAQDTKKFDTLDTFSSFKYENYLQILKNLLKKHDQPLQQVVRRYIERNNIKEPHKLHTSLSDFAMDRKSIHIKGPLIEGCCNLQYYIIKSSNATIRADTLADNCCGLSNGNIVQVKNIVHHKNLNTDVIIGNEFLHREDLYDKPCPSSLLGIFVVDKLSDLKIWPVKDIKTKYVQLPLNNKLLSFHCCIYKLTYVILYSTRIHNGRIMVHC